MNTQPRKTRDWSVLQTTQGIADALKTCFAEVTINGSEDHPVVYARGWNKTSDLARCTHKQLTIAKGVRVWVDSDGYLRSNDKTFLVSEVVFCSRCEKVMRKVV